MGYPPVTLLLPWWGTFLLPWWDTLGGYPGGTVLWWDTLVVLYPGGTLPGIPSWVPSLVVHTVYTLYTAVNGVSRLTPVKVHQRAEGPP